MRRYFSRITRSVWAAVTIFTVLAGMFMPLEYALALSPPTYASQWATSDGPQFLAVDSSDNIYAYEGASAIRKYANSGGSPLASVFTNNGGLAVSAAGVVYHPDQDNDVVKRYNTSLVFQSNFGSSGTAEGQFSGPTGVAVDSSGNIYVVDSGNKRVQKFNSSATFQIMWGYGVQTGANTFETCTSSCQTGLSGSGDGQFTFPYDIVVTPAGNVYVADLSAKRIQEFTSGGSFVTKWGSSGSGDGQFNSPYGLGTDAGNRIYVADSSNNRVQVFDASGTFLTKWGSAGSGDGQFTITEDVVTDSSGVIFVADIGNSRIQTFTALPLDPGPSAGSTASARNTLTSSAPSDYSNHTIEFTTTNPVPAAGRIRLTFAAGFNMNSIDYQDMDLSIGGSDQTLAAVPSGATWGAALSGQVVTFTSDTGTISAAAAIVIRIGTNATVGTTGDTQIINPSSVGSYNIHLETTDELIDEGDAYVAIVYPVDLNANVNATFTFIVDGEDSGGTIDDEVVASASSPLYVGFGTLTPATPVTMGSSLSVTTNAANGFVVTIEQNHNMLASSGADIDSFKDGATQYPAATWTAPTGTIGNELTYGHLGITTEDSSTITSTASVTTGSDGEFIGLAAGTPRTIWSYSGPSDGLTQDIGHIDVGYRIAITALQEAGRYQNRLMYIATPTF